jgi:hypothetical protein
VVEGTSWIGDARAGKWTQLDVGDVLLLNGSQVFILASAPGVPAMDAEPFFSEAHEGIAQVGSGREGFLVGGTIELDDLGARILADALPPMSYLPAHTRDAAGIRLMLDRLNSELRAKRPGSTVAAEQWTRLILLEALRLNLQAGGDDRGRWLNGLRDRRTRRAIELMHAELGRPWRVEDLAWEAGMSRTPASRSAT